MELSQKQKLAWLRLIRSENVGPSTFRQLINREGSAEAALEALPQLARKLGKTIRVPSIGEAEKEFEQVERAGGRVVLQGEKAYPPLLQFIGGAPPVLSVLGGERLDWARSIALVGARNASAAGLKMAALLAHELGEAGYATISGLARGVDGAVHKASLRTGTVAVLAGGLARVYPDEHLGLAQEILDNGGALLSEMPFSWEPRARDFPRRNRLVSGTSQGVVVVEAAKRSGSLITAQYALEQNREVFAVPGSPLDPRAEGGNHLIQQGARLITNARDIIDSLQQFRPGPGEFLEPDWVPDDGYLDQAVHTTDELGLLISALSVSPVHVDDIVRATGLRASKVQGMLLELDLEGRVEWSSGQYVALMP
jgi:DNA processing protein